VQDGLGEPDETVVLTLVPDAAYAIGTPSATVTLSDIGANQSPVIADQGFSVPENSANGTVVGTVAASDPDAGQTLVYAVTAGNTGNAFAINSSTGEVTVANASALDFETTPTFSLTVQVTDDGMPALSASATVTVNLTDVNEGPTDIGLSSASVSENQASGTAVGTLSTVDPDGGGTFTYTLAAGTGSADNGSFTITSGTLRTAAVFNYEAKSSCSIRVRSTDAGGLWTEKVFAISVTDVNEGPVISNQAFSVPENCPNGTVAGTVVASDPDAGQTLVYAIAAGNTDDAFAIDAATGQLTVANASALDAETTPTFSLTVQVTDNGTPALAATGTVTVAVKEHLTVTGVMLNGRAGRSASAIEPSGLGVQSLRVTFSRTATFGPEAVLVQTVAFTGNAETVTGTLMPASLAGSGTSVMTLALAPGSVVDTWVKVTLRGDGTVHGASGQALDGESKGGSGRSYVYDASLDLPTGNGSPGGDAVFYVGSLRGDFSGDGLVRDEDFEGFFGAWEAGRPEADFCGVGFGESQPDGQVRPSDIDGFLSAYNSAVAEGRHLDSLPDPGPLAQGAAGPLATGSPEPVAPAPEDPFAASAAEADVLGVVPEMSFAEAPGAAPGGATPEETPQQILLPASVAAGGGEPVQTADWLVASDVPLAFGAADELAPLSPDPVLTPDGGLDLLGLSAPVL